MYYTLVASIFHNLQAFIRSTVVNSLSRNSSFVAPVHYSRQICNKSFKLLHRPWRFIKYFPDFLLETYLEKALAKSELFEKKLDTLLPRKHKKVIIFFELQIPTFYSITKVIHQTSDLCTLTDNRKTSAAELVLE